MLNIPNLPGPELRKLRESLGLSRSKFSETIGISESTVVRKEGESGAIGPELASLIEPYLANEYDAGLELGLSVAAIAKAEQQGLRSASTSFGPVFWRPSIHEWASRFRGFVPRSLASQALHLAELLGLTPDEGTVRCAQCEVRGLEPAAIAFRRCAFCHVALCMSDSCGDYFLAERHDVRLAFPVACAGCLARRQLLRRGTEGYLPGRGNYTDHLVKRFEECSSPPSKSHLQGLVPLVGTARDEASARRAAIIAALQTDGALAFTATHPDMFMNLRVALAEANRDVDLLGGLFERLNSMLKTTI